MSEEEIGEDFDALCTTISSIYDLRGIGAKAVHVWHGMCDWMQWIEQNAHRLSRIRGEQSYEESRVVWKTTKSGKQKVTFKPYGADHNIPVKVKRGGEAPWKIIVTYKEYTK